MSDEAFTCAPGRSHFIALDEAQLLAAIDQVPPGRNLAGEYIRLRSYIRELQEQVTRSIELRIVAEQRAGKKNVHALEERIEAYEEALAVALAAGDVGRSFLEKVALENEASPAARELLGLAPNE